MLNILYISELCSSEKNKDLFEKHNIKDQEGQKFHRLLTSGLGSQNDVSIDILSTLPINSKITSKRIFKKENEISKGIKYTYIFFINLAIIRQITYLFGIFVNTVMWLNKHKDNRIIVCDVLRFSALLGCLCASVIKKCKVLGIVTDLPTFRIQSIKLKGFKKRIIDFYNNINHYFAKKCDAFLLLTNDMSNIINVERKPYIVIEGLVDINMALKDNILLSKYQRKVCHYAGRVSQLYGLENLVQAFIEASIQGAELHIYGDGDYVPKLKELGQKYQNVKYFGYVSNDIIVDEQLKSTLLINPRPTNEEYTKYSFPSKNMEYMASGTPMLTTKLSCIPEEYIEHIYLINDDSVNGIKESLTRVLSKSSEELYNKGKEAREFVLKDKNNVVQARKVVDFVYKVI